MPSFIGVFEEFIRYKNSTKTFKDNRESKNPTEKSYMISLQEEHLGTLSGLSSSISLPATYTINIWVKNVNLDGTQQWANLYLQNSGYRYVLDAHYGRIGAGNWTSNLTPDSSRLSLAAGDPLKVADTWHLVTVTYDGSTMEYFANGVSIGTVDPTANATPPTAIDVLNGPANQEFAAEVRDLRVYEGVATSQQIADSYNNNGVLSLEDGLVAKWLFDGNLQDETGNHNATSPTGAETYVANSGNEWFEYPGNGTDYVSVPYSEDLVPTDAMTVSTWIKYSALGNHYDYFITANGHNATPSSDHMSWVLGRVRQNEGVVPANSPINNSGKFYFQIQTQNGYISAVDHQGDDLSAGSIDTEVWYHVVGTYDGSMVRIYVDGVLAGEYPQTGQIVQFPGQPITMNYHVIPELTLPGNAPGQAALSQDDTRIWNRALAAGEITSLYNETNLYNNNGQITQGENNMSYKYHVLARKRGPHIHTMEVNMVLGLESWDASIADTGATMNVKFAHVSPSGNNIPDWESYFDKAPNDWTQLPVFSAVVETPTLVDSPTYDWADYKLVITHANGENTVIFMTDPDAAGGVSDMAFLDFNSDYSLNFGNHPFGAGSYVASGDFEADSMFFIGDISEAEMADIDTDAGVFPNPHWLADSNITYSVMGIPGLPSVGTPISGIGFAFGSTFANPQIQFLGSPAESEQKILYLKSVFDAANANGGEMLPIFYRDTNPEFGGFHANPADNTTMAAVDDAILLGYAILANYTPGSTTMEVGLFMDDPSNPGSLIPWTEDYYNQGFAPAPSSVLFPFMLGVTNASYNPESWDGLTGVPTVATVVAKRLVMKMPTLVLDEYHSELQAFILDGSDNIIASATSTNSVQGDPIEFVFGTVSIPNPNFHATEGSDLVGHKILIRDSYGDGIGTLVGDGSGVIELYLRDESDVDSAVLASVSVTTAAASYLDTDGKPGVYFDFDCESEVMTVGELLSDEVNLSTSGGSGGVVPTRTRIDAAIQVDFGFVDAFGVTYETMEDMIAAEGLNTAQLARYTTPAFDPRVIKYSLAHSQFISGDQIVNKAYVDQEIADANTEIDEAIDAIGLTGSYAAHASARYITAATSLHNADLLLDTAISGVQDNVDDNAADILSLSSSVSSSLAALDLELSGDITNLSSSAAADRASIRTEFANADTALSGALMATISALQSDVDQNEADADAAITSLSGAVAADLAALQSDVDQNEADADAAITSLSGAVAADLAALQSDVDQNEADADAAITSLSGAVAADLAALQSDVDQNEADADAAITSLSGAVAADLAALQSDVDQNEADADAAIAVERGRIDAILSGSGVDLDQLVELVAAYELADTNIITSITNLQGDVTSLSGAVASDLAALQSDVDQNEADADAAITSLSGAVAADLAALQSDVDQNEADADAAITSLSGAVAADLAALQSDVDQNEADADAAITSLSGAVAADLAALQSDVDQNEADADAAITSLSGAVAADLLAMETDYISRDNQIVSDYIAADTALSGALMATITALQSDVDQNEADADAAITSLSGAVAADLAALQSDVDQNEADADAAITSLSGAVAADLAALQADVDQNEADADAAITSLSGAVAADLAALQADVDQNEADADAAITSLSGAFAADLAALQSDVDQNEADADAAITSLSGAVAADLAALQSDVDQNEADADAAIAVERGRIDAILSGSGVDLDQLVELVAAYELADTNIITSITNLQGDVTSLSGAVAADLVALQSDVDQNEADADLAISNLQADVDANELQHDQEMKDMFGDNYVSGAVGGISFVAHTEDQMWPLQSSDLHLAVDFGDALKKMDERLQASEYGLQVTHDVALEMMSDVETLQSEVQAMQDEVEGLVETVVSGTNAVVADVRGDIALVRDMICQETEVLTSDIAAGGTHAIQYNASEIQLVSLNGQILTEGFDYNFDVASPQAITMTFGLLTGDRMVVVYKKDISLSSSVIVNSSDFLTGTMTDPSSFATKVSDASNDIATEEEWGAAIPTFPLS